MNEMVMKINTAKPLPNSEGPIALQLSQTKVIDINVGIIGS